jgi:rhamnulose-1-phosphate aldolase
MRDLARCPMENGSVIRILDDCALIMRSLLINPVLPTSELPSHLAVHNRLGGTRFRLQGYDAYAPY